MIADRVDVGADDNVTSAYLARRYGVSIRTLRFFEEKGLLAPKRLGDVRLFSSQDTIRIELILTGRRLGLSLDDIGSLIQSHLVDRRAAPANRSEPHDFVTLQKQLALLEAQKTGLDAAIAELNARLNGKASDDEQSL